MHRGAHLSLWFIWRQSQASSAEVAPLKMTGEDILQQAKQIAFQYLTLKIHGTFTYFPFFAGFPDFAGVAFA